MSSCIFDLADEKFHEEENQKRLGKIASEISNGDTPPFDILLALMDDLIIKKVGEDSLYACRRDLLVDLFLTLEELSSKVPYDIFLCALASTLYCELGAANKIKSAVEEKIKNNSFSSSDRDELLKLDTIFIDDDVFRIALINEAKQLKINDDLLKALNFLPNDIKEIFEKEKENQDKDKLEDESIKNLINDYRNGFITESFVIRYLNENDLIVNDLYPYLTKEEFEKILNKCKFKI